MRRLIDKVIRSEENKKLCPSCDSVNSKDSETCSECGFDFSVKTSTPEDGL